MSYDMLDRSPLVRATDAAIARENERAIAAGPTMRVYRFTIGWQGDSYAVLDNLSPIPGEGGYSREDAVQVCEQYRSRYNDTGVLV